MHYYFDVFKKYAVFSGRASRKEYWMFILFNAIVNFVLGLVLGFIGAIAGIDPIYANIVVLIYGLAILVPSIAVGIRRMHDVDKSGWFILIPIYNLILVLSSGTKGVNKYGPEPNVNQEPLPTPSLPSQS